MTVTDAPTRLHRPYARIRNKRERSVTEIIGVKAIPGLPFGAANETAAFAVYHEDAWHDLPADEAYELLRRHHRGVWDGRAAIGTASHIVLESWFNGHTVELYDVVADLIESDKGAKSWRDHETETVTMLEGYLNGLEKWWLDFQPEGGASEECVRTPGVYIGQRDRWNVRCKGLPGVGGIDLKTTARQEADKGVYIDSWTLQLNAYAAADECVDYDLDKRGRVVEVGTRPNPPVEWLGVVHLRGDDNYSFYEVEQDERHLNAFLNLAKVNKWAGEIEKVEPRLYQKEGEAA